MGRRRRRVVRIVKKKLPTVFICPRCGEEAVRVTIAKDTGHATVLCALCNLKDDFPAHPAAQPIDVYSYFTDRFYGVKEPRAIIPREREVSQAPREESTEEEIGGPEPPMREESESSSPVLAQTGENVVPDVAVAAPRVRAELEPSDEKQAKDEMPAEPVLEATGAPEADAEKESEEESEPFADILENKDKKRYSSQPLPQQSSEQTS